MPPHVVLVSDSPYGPSGLGRIARDLLTRVQTARARETDPLPCTLGAIGWEADPPWTGRPDWYVGHEDAETWGARVLERYVAERVDPRDPLVVWSIWDPGRCFALRQARLPKETTWWGYFAVDGQNVRGAIGGPAAAAVRGYDRVLAYTRYGRRVLGATLGRDVPDLPHGIDPVVFHPRQDQASWELLGAVCAPVVKPTSVLVGAVATNQPRKDLGLLFGAVAAMRRDGPVKLWLHVDREVGPAWSVPQLAEDFGLSRHLVVTTSLTDAQLAALYSWCAVTIAPGLGEGFGYPIVESLACGTPVVHGTYAGGLELVPRPQWRFPERQWRLESAYAIRRPVFDPQDVANAAWTAVKWRQAEPAVVREYCTTSVAHLHWPRLWPAWEQWVRRGLQEVQA